MCRLQTCQSASCQARLVGKCATSQPCKGLAVHVKAEEVHSLHMAMLQTAWFWVRDPAVTTTRLVPCEKMG